VRQALAILRQPPAAVRIAGWLCIAGLIIGSRVWIALHLPTYLWTRDSGSYVASAVNWLEGQPWATSARRGPVYSLFIALIGRAGGSFTTVATVQHVIGGLTAMLTIAMARLWLGRSAFWPLLFCSFWYALFGMPMELECLIRNETLLVLFSTVAFGGWFFALQSGSAAWSGASGLASGLLQLLKGIFPIFPLLTIAGFAWHWRREPARACLLAGCYLVIFVVPLAGSKIYTRASHTESPAEPEAGEMFYGRTAQWTFLDGGVAPDLKTRIRPQVEAYIHRYRTTGRLDNNEIVKRTVVPALKDILINERHLQPADVDRLCWKLGLEAAQHHPGEFLRQVVHDEYFLNFITVQRMIFFKVEELPPSVKDATQFASEHYGAADHLAQRLFGLENAARSVSAGIQPHSGLQIFARFLHRLAAWRLVSPVFVTTVLLPFLIYKTRAADRVFWLGMAALWYYYLALLGSVGRPLDRYLMPVVPITFWAYSTGLTMLWNAAWQRGWLRVEPAATAADPAS
jgi:hypothetical protein